MEDFLEIITKTERKGMEKCLERFCNDYATKMKFNELDKGDLRSAVWGGIFRSLSDENEFKIHPKCLEALRILSRDKTDLNQLVTDERLSTIIHKAGVSDDRLELSYDVAIVEALKLLCNVIYHSEVIQIQLPKTECLKNLVKRIQNQNSKCQFTYNIGLLFDIRLLFLATAYDSTCRNTLKEEVKADVELIRTLDRLSHEIKSEKNEELTENYVGIACEILKALFNLYLDSDDSTDCLKSQHEKLVDILYTLLLIKSKTDDIHSHTANLLTVIPLSSFRPIIPSANLIKKVVGHHVYENMDMTAVHQLLLLLDKRLDNPQNLIDNISPVVTALVNLSKSQRLIRKWIRQQVLPSLKRRDVMHRPEEDPHLRGKLCKLLTSPITEIRDLVAEFLFILCKENGRMIKYTGYGNAAGMFANKGLLGAVQRETEYSSESGGSDTEEYAKYKENINPVTGCYEEVKPNPLDGMTEEQKEHEVLNLVNLVNQLTDNGVIQPCTIGEDGKPRPVQHVLELQEGLPKRQKAFQDDNDSE
ncbi:synembryn isoform X2 [Diachasma alloeum]|uniref:synembryn isoform X2 n=1 Tax=Diachasma alloeum TaxID=454923 RepID=UPI0007381CF8|nr:synembryn isoform X2 [Diachasma alloeum]